MPTYFGLQSYMELKTKVDTMSICEIFTKISDVRFFKFVFYIDSTITIITIATIKILQTPLNNQTYSLHTDEK